ncbi:hypothetical protein Fmac_026358 [Flemingia macrophylla]|uniref:Uncharacterized protein n=1 Tax=Flemingia macrophylla TaxID=520843 RepID=A0ABD1LEM9_9FABA
MTLLGYVPPSINQDPSFDGPCQYSMHDWVGSLLTKGKTWNLNFNATFLLITVSLQNVFNSTLPILWRCRTTRTSSFLPPLFHYSVPINTYCKNINISLS